MKKLLFALVLLASFLGFIQAGAGQAAEGPPVISLSLAGLLGIPVGADSSYFGLGGGTRLLVEYAPPALKFLSFSAGVLWQAALLTGEGVPYPVMVHLLGFGAGVAGQYDVVPRLTLRGGIHSGYCFANPFQDPEGAPTGSTLYLVASAGAGYRVLDWLTIGLGASYWNYFGLYNDISVALGTSFHLVRAGTTPAEAKPRTAPAAKPRLLEKEKPPEKPPEPEKKKGKGLALSQVSFADIFPVFFKYYDTHPIGSATLVNWDKDPVEDLRVSFYAKQYMDNPQPCRTPARLAQEEEGKIEIAGLFTSSVLEISEGTKVSALLIAEYTQKGKAQRKELPVTMRLYGRNEMTWDDDRKPAAFVTAKDPSVLRFAKNVAGAISGRGSSAVNARLQTGMAMHNALALFGMSYVVDPRTPHKDISQSKGTVDYLQFPWQSLEFKAGDCDDLSILSCALLESVGVPTAFITVPGHIFIAFGLGMSPAEARGKFLRPDELIFRDEETWVPVEVTDIRGGFLKAWQSGAKTWREHEARGQAGFHSMTSSWAEFEAVDFTKEQAAVALPDREKVIGSFTDELTRFIDREIYPQAAKLQAEVQKTQEAPPAVNRLGVLYAVWGLEERAEREFTRALKREEYVPALLNMGNLHFLRGDNRKAGELYERAYRKAPSDPKVLLSVARVNHELENYGLVRETYEKLKQVAPDLAARFAYLDLRGDEAARAADLAQVKGVVVWAEE